MRSIAERDEICLEIVHWSYLDAATDIEIVVELGKDVFFCSRRSKNTININ